MLGTVIIINIIIDMITIMSIIFLPEQQAGAYICDM